MYPPGVIIATKTTKLDWAVVREFATFLLKPS